jgi:hypothetical protein
MRSPNPEAFAAGKPRLDAMKSVLKADAAKRGTVGPAERYAQLGERIERIRHQTLATSLVDARPARLNHRALQTALTQGDGNRQPSRPAAYNERVQHARLIQSRIFQGCCIVKAAGARTCRAQGGGKNRSSVDQTRLRGPATQDPPALSLGRIRSKKVIVPTTAHATGQAKPPR